ncbi:DUF397 domain-containing protein [Streptomyces chattanoogensis]
MAQDIAWQKSTFSSGGDSADCVELAALGGAVLLRESDAPTQVLSASPTELAAFVRHIRAEVATCA